MVITPPTLRLVQSRVSVALVLTFSIGAQIITTQASAQNIANAISENPVAPKVAKVEEVLTKKLGTITVTGVRPSALPTHIPTTMESIMTTDIAEKINATDAQDALKYFPSLMVRKRYIGDFDHAVLASRASGTGNSARSLVYADGILLSNLLGNGAAFTPRWGVVSPEEIERVDVLYGPYSAGFSGNSVGAVVDYITRMPSKLEASVKLQGFTQRFNLYGSNDRYSGNQWSVTLGSREGGFSWWLSLNHLNSDGHPIAYSNKVISTATVGTSGAVVTGAVVDRNPTGLDWLLTGATNQIHTLQDNAKIKLAYDFSPTLRASYLFGQWRNDATRNAQSYLRDAAGAPLFSGTANIGGRQYSIAANEISISRQDLEHQIHGLSLKSNTGGVFDWEAAASLYDYATDLSRAPAPSNALPSAYAVGVGRLTDLGGTGWNTFSLRGTWRPSGFDKAVDAHLVDFGLQREAFKLRTLVSDTLDWQGGDAAARFSAFQGNTSLESLYAQDTWFFASAWRSTIGLRLEKWQAKNGAISNATSTQTLGSRSETSVSPKFALAYQAAPQWVLKASLGRAVRNPTVAELYQGSIASNAVVNNDPNLKAEKSWTTEWTAEYELGAFQKLIVSGSARATAFFESTENALYSQTNFSVTPNITNIQNVDKIRTKGIELSLQASGVFLPNLDLTASFTFADSRTVKNDKNPSSVGKWQPRVPRTRANLALTYRATDQLSTTLAWRYSGTQYGALDNSDINANSYLGFSKFSVADVRTQYRLNKNWTFSAGVDNLNNQKYWAFHPYPQRTYSGDIKWTY